MKAGVVAIHAAMFAVAMCHGVAIAQPPSDVIPGQIEQQSEAQESRPEPAPAGPVPEEQPPDSASYEADCKRPQTAQEANLCEQRRIADATEELVALTGWRVSLSYFEIGALVATVLFTALAAVAAALAARAANASVRVADITAERQLRAYFGVFAARIKIIQLINGGLGLAIRIEVKNSGQTPAYGCRTWMRGPTLRSKGDAPDDIPLPVGQRDGAAIVGPGTILNLDYVLPVSPEQFGALDKGQVHVMIAGGLDYTDAFDKPRYFIFRMRSGHKSSQWRGWSMHAHERGHEGD